MNTPSCVQRLTTLCLIRTFSHLSVCNYFNMSRSWPSAKQRDSEYRKGKTKIIGPPELFSTKCLVITLSIFWMGSLLYLHQKYLSIPYLHITSPMNASCITVLQCFYPLSDSATNPIIPIHPINHYQHHPTFYFGGTVHLIMMHISFKWHPLSNLIFYQNAQQS